MPRPQVIVREVPPEAREDWMRDFSSLELYQDFDMIPRREFQFYSWIRVLSIAASLFLVMSLFTYLVMS